MNTETSSGVDDDPVVLRSERDSAVARVRQLEHELGQLRGQVKRMELVMWRRVQRRQRWEGRLRRVARVVRRR